MPAVPELQAMSSTGAILPAMSEAMSSTGAGVSVSGHVINHDKHDISKP